MALAMQKGITETAAERTQDHTSRSRFSERIRMIWPLLVMAFGLLATAAWVALLGWLLYRAILGLA